MQVTYFNDSERRINIYRNNLSDFVGSVSAKAFVTFVMDVPAGHGLFIKHWPTDSVLISTIPLQGE